MKLLVWNYNGAVSREFLSISKELMKKNRPNVIGLVETKLNSEKADEVCNKLNFDSWIGIETVGYNGGIWAL